MYFYIVHLIYIVYYSTVSNSQSCSRPTINTQIKVMIILIRYIILVSHMYVYMICATLALPLFDNVAKHLKLLFCQWSSLQRLSRAQGKVRSEHCVGTITNGTQLFSPVGRISLNQTQHEYDVTAKRLRRAICD